MKALQVFKFSLIFALICVCATFTWHQMHLGHVGMGIILMLLWIVSGKFLFWKMDQHPEAARTFCVIVTMASLLFAVDLCFHHLAQWYLPALMLVFMGFWGYLACCYDHEVRIS